MHPISFARVSRLIDGSGVVASRGWSVVTTTAMFCFCLAIPVAGIMGNRQPGPPPLCKDIADERSPSAGRAVQPDVVRPRHRLRPTTASPRIAGMLLGASLVWTAGAILSVISVADAWQHRNGGIRPVVERSLGAIRASYHEPLTEAQLLDGDNHLDG